MDNIELSNQPSKRSKSATIIDLDDHVDHSEELTAASTQHSRENIVPPKSVPSVKEPKKSFGQRLYAKVPPYQLTRTIIKASIAILIALLFVFEENCRKAIGQAGILVPIGTLLYFPIRPIGN
jgi:hypothetical protein